MNYFEFVYKWNGKQVDMDNFPVGDKYQCVDLMRRYFVDVLGLEAYVLPGVGNGGAKDIYYRTPSNHPKFQKINNLPWNVPKQGDIIFWKSGVSGHVAIYNTGNVWKFNSFDQNWNGVKRCALVDHNYSGVIGWLRPRK